MLNRIGLFLILSVTITVPATSRDYGQYAGTDPKIKEWVKGLKSKASGSSGCCDIADGQPPEAVWKMEGKYRVQIHGEFHDVPDDALITEVNKLGYAVVWYYETDRPDKTKQVNIRCFMPGTTAAIPSIVIHASTTAR